MTGRTPSPVDLSDRDVAVLRTVQHCGLIRADQLERLHFAGLSDSSRARRRRAVLHRLVRTEHLLTLERRVGGVRSGSVGYVFRIGPAGIRALQSDGRIRRSEEPGQAFVQHRLQTVEVYVQAHESEAEMLAAEIEPTAWRRYGSSNSAMLKPDLFLDIADGAHAHAWFIEVDLGTERSPALKRKATSYHDALRSGLQENGTFPRVLWLTANERRSQFIQRAIAGTRAPPGLHTVAVGPTTPADLIHLLTAPASSTPSN